MISGVFVWVGAYAVSPLLVPVTRALSPSLESLSQIFPDRLTCFTGVSKVELRTQRCVKWPIGLPNSRIHNLDLLLRSIVEDSPSHEHVSAQVVALFASRESFRGVPVRKVATGGWQVKQIRKEGEERRHRLQGVPRAFCVLLPGVPRVYQFLVWCSNPAKPTARYCLPRDSKWKRILQHTAIQGCRRAWEADIRSAVLTCTRSHHNHWNARIWQTHQCTQLTVSSCWTQSFASALTWSHMLPSIEYSPKRIFWNKTCNCIRLNLAQLTCNEKEVKRTEGNIRTSPSSSSLSNGELPCTPKNQRYLSSPTLWFLCGQKHSQAEEERKE